MQVSFAGGISMTPFGISRPHAAGAVCFIVVRIRLFSGVVVLMTSSLVQPCHVAGKFNKSAARVSENNHRGAEPLLEPGSPWQLLDPHQYLIACSFTFESSHGTSADVVDVLKRPEGSYSSYGLASGSPTAHAVCQTLTTTAKTTKTPRWLLLTTHPAGILRHFGAPSPGGTQSSGYWGFCVRVLCSAVRVAEARQRERVRVFQCSPQNFAGTELGEALDERHEPGPLEGSESLLREARDVFEQRRVFCALDGDGDLHSPQRVVTTEDAQAPGGNGGLEQLFQLEGVHVLTTGDDPVRKSSKDMN